MPLAKIYLTRDIFTVIVYILYLYTPNILWGIMEFKCVTFKFIDGERYCELVDKATGVPLWYPNLFITTQIRNGSQSVSTMESNLRAIKLLLEYCDDNQIDLESRIKKMNLFSLSEIDGLRDHCQRRSVQGNEIRPTRSRNILAFPSQAPRRVSKAFEDQRLTYIANYLEWFPHIILETSYSTENQRRVAQMVQQIRARRPPIRRSTQITDKALDDSELELLLQVADPEHPDNPFKSTATRNELIIKMLVHLGIRRGELLGIRVEDINLRSQTVTVHRRPDEVADPRVRQPNAKTLARTLSFGAELAELISNYIVTVRNKVLNSNRHDYLLVVHHSGKYQGQPLGVTGLDKIFRRIRQAFPKLAGLHPHTLRHTWNWRLSQSLDQLPKHERPSPAVEEAIRNHHNGWVSGSKTAAVYNERHIRLTAQKLSLRLQSEYATKKEINL